MAYYINAYVGRVRHPHKGLPIINEIGHGIGMRSMVTFAGTNDYLLNFSCIESKFALRLVMGV